MVVSRVGARFPAYCTANGKALLAQLPEDVTVKVDAHSSSPAFSEDAKMLSFDLLKVGAESKDELVERLDVSDPEDLQMGIMRREIAAGEAQQRAEALKALGKKH